MNKLSLEYINLRTGGTSAHHPVNDGVYLKTIIKEDDGAIALFPTTISMTIFDGVEFYSEMKLNIFKKKHPDFERQRENLRKLFYATGAGEVYTTRLIYGTDEVAVVDGDGIYMPDGSTILPENYDVFRADLQFKADAIVTDRSNVALVMYAADCPTAFLHDHKTGAIGVLHSMWRGMVIERDGKYTSIVKATVEKMIDTYGTDPADLEVTIFPCIGLSQFEVGREVVDQFEAAGLEKFVHVRDDGAYFIDLNAAMIELFVRSGVERDMIEDTPFTTADYGLNSLRMAPTNYATEDEKGGLIDRESYLIMDSKRPEEPMNSVESDQGILKTSALNFLIALKK